MMPRTVGWRCPLPGGGGHSEWALACDRGRGRRLLIVPALFDEAPRMRRLAVAVMQRLDGAGIDSLLPDLPGWGESLADPAMQNLADWRLAMAGAAAAFGAGRVLAIRGGALIAPDLPGWALAPVAGAALLRHLLRGEVVSAREAGREESIDGLIARGRRQGIAPGGHRLSAEMVAELLAAVAEDPSRHTIAPDMLGGAPLWLRAEPADDPGQADALAAIVAMGMPAAETGPPAPAPLVPVDLAAPGVIRSALSFTCAGVACAATLDGPVGAPADAPALLWVTGGRELRAGHAASQARAAATLAAAGHPVLRYDRRGVGDSDGTAAPFADTAPDIAAALAALRAARPAARRIIAYGNCDAASALMLHAGALAVAGLVLANPWTFAGADDAEGGDGADGAARGAGAVHALRAHYRRRLTDPGALKRLLRGEVNLWRSLRGLAAASRPAAAAGPLASAMAAGLAGYAGDVRLLIAGRDRTGAAFLGGWDAGDVRVRRCPDAGHIFAEAPAWWHGQIIAALRDDEDAPPTDAIA